MTKSPLVAWLRTRVSHLAFLLLRPMTLGARALVFDEAGRVFLVRHSYVAGWHIPGGGVEAGETVLTSLARELAEEGNIEITGAPALHGIFFNRASSRRDHVAVYIVREFRQSAPPKPNWEIVETGFFSLDALPADTGRATRARLAELFEGAPLSPEW